MKPVYEAIPHVASQSLYCEEIRGTGFGCTWHFHPEYELTLTLRGHGYRMVGDDVAQLSPGDLVLLGPNLPHDWQQVPTPAAPAVHAIVIQFRDDFPGGEFWHCPETGRIRQLLQRAARGLAVRGDTRDVASRRIETLVTLRGMKRLLALLDLLHMLSESDELREIASPGFAPVLNGADEGRMGKVAAYLREHLSDPIYLKEVARVANLSEGAFTRFIKTRTGKTFLQYLTEMRIGRACERLSSSEASVTEVAFACGYRNLSNFNRHFRRLKGLTPSDYRKLFAA